VTESISILNIPSQQLTPGMRQYQDAKRANPDCLILLRMGDFYEMFYEDAITCSKELEITLTSRGKHEKKAPLAGIPYHALDNYLGRLIKKGYKVAIIEQLEDPKQAKGLVKRGLVRIVTPGTVIDSSMLNDKENNYIMSLTSQKVFSVAFCDISTGEFLTSSFSNKQSLLNEIHRLSPSECVIPKSLEVNQDLIAKIKFAGCFINSHDDYHFRFAEAEKTLLDHFKLTSLASFGLHDSILNVCVSGGLLHYLISTQKNSLSQIKSLALQNNQHMLLDYSTLRNLEITKNIQDSPKSTLLNVLDKTVTSMGARLLKRWLTAPLLQLPLIQNRLDSIEIFNKNVIPREEIISLLTEIYDLERLISRVNYGNASPRDLLALKTSLQKLPAITQLLSSLPAELLQAISKINPLHEITALLESSIREDAPVVLREGGLIKPSYNAELADLQNIRNNSKTFLQELEAAEKKSTGITTLRIAYNRVFGYFIEVTKKNLHLVPATYTRKQTTANAERFITEELKFAEEKILNAEDKISQLEFTLFQDILRKVAATTIQIQNIASKIATLDVLSALAKVAMENNYVKPRFIADSALHIRNGRHPVVERATASFIGNDIFLNHGEMMLITGPNMAGKSTVMRQTALIVLMAQVGSFVPADDCVLNLFDRIFTRVGAHDDLAAGQSTFLVEMTETASILHNATSKSLIILDEIGRGTSTFDGVSIAWSVAEHIYNNVKAKTLFATHYHVLNKLSDRFGSVKNYNLAVKDVKGELVFLRKLISGGTDRSYGVHVARLAGLPSVVIDRATEIQTILEKDDSMMRRLQAKKLEDQKDLGDFSP
jgi:DNA mismatch repair protein MutS